MARLLLVALLLIVAFKNRFKYLISRQAAQYAGLFLLGSGTFAAFSRTIVYAVADYVKFFDFFFIVLAGVVLTLSSMTYGYRLRKLPLRPITAQKLSKATEPLKGQTSAKTT